VEEELKIDFSGSLTGMGHGSERDLSFSKTPAVLNLSLSSSDISGSFSKSRRSVLIRLMSCFKGTYSDKSFLALSWAVLRDSSDCLMMLSKALMSAWICLNSSTWAIFSCWSSSSSLLYSFMHFSSSSSCSTSHKSDTLVFSRFIVLLRISFKASNFAKACLSSIPVILKHFVSTSGSVLQVLLSRCQVLSQQIVSLFLFNLLFKAEHCSFVSRSQYNLEH